ncbi:MAG: PrsW family glutamic-type intramembrane protease [bacterium]|nr:PrsW family glutamic-type intramembrane protease [bacterium]
MVLPSSTFFFAFLGGILPALLWLWFWLREDRLAPEPRGLIFATFCAGMVATLVALIVESWLRFYFAVPGSENNPSSQNLLMVTVWAAVEEIAKFGVAYFVVLRRRENDEPIDNMIYLITAALGFAAMENAFFLIDPIQSGSLVQSLITGDLRFIGSTLLHLVSSSVIGIFMAFSFCKLPGIKRKYLLTGIILAILLHTLFNFFIIVSDNNLFSVFGFVWTGIIALLLFFEKAKRINRSCVY